MALTTIMRINGETLSQLGIDTVSSPPLGYAGVQRDSHAVLGSLGGVPASSGVGIPKTIPLRFVLGATTIENRKGELDTLMGKLGGLLEIEFGFATDRLYWGYADNLPMQGRWDSVAYVEGDAVINLLLVVPRGHATARDAIVRHIGTAYTEVTGLGELPSAPVIIAPGAVTDFTITYADRDEVRIWKLTTTGTVAADEYLESDSGTQRIIIGNEDTGVRTLTMSFFDHTPNDKRDRAFPIFDPRDGSGGNGPLVKADVACTAYYTANYP